MKNKHLVCSFAAVALLAACGGGGGDTAVTTAPAPAPAPAPSSDVPASATASAAGALAFVSQTAATSSDSADPINVGDATLGSSETDEPAAI